MTDKGKLIELSKLFFKLGLISFGGPAASIAMIESEVVRKKRWMSEQHFLDLVGATNLIPGPNSTEMAMHCGNEYAGWRGLIAAGLSFIFPAVIITGVLAFLYVRFGEVPAVEPFLYGIKPAVIAIIIGAVYSLGMKALKSWPVGIIGLFVFIAAFFGVSEIATILGAGLAGMIWFGLKGKLNGNYFSMFLPLMILNPEMPVKVFSSLKLFLVFLKIGAVLFGGGYVLVAYLDGELVEKLGWLTKQELMDAIAIGQFTPGPILSTATFIGYQLNGVWGALLATIGIFLPSFFFVLILNPFVPKLRSSAVASGFLDSVNIAAVALMIVVSIRLGQDILIDWKAWFIALLSIGVTLIYKKVSAFWIVIGGAILGYVFTLF
jgi:chromate transporter